jgi:hypothetical protein
MEPRLQRRYRQLMAAHLSDAQRLAAGLHPLPTEADPFAAVQAAWRFYANPRVGLPQLAGPLIASARSALAMDGQAWALHILDWSPLQYGHHARKADRTTLTQKKDLGYQLLTGLIVSPRDGAPLAPVCLEVQAADGVHSTRATTLRPPCSRLDALSQVIEHVEGLRLGRPLVHVIDREGDSVGHYRQWQAQAWRFLVRADDQRRVLHEGRECPLAEVAERLAEQGQLAQTRPVHYQGREAWQWVGETTVVLNRPARQHRVRNGKARHVMVPGPPVTLRLVVSEVREEAGGRLARWLLLTNLPASVDAATAALWYYWRWRIESYHKLLKGAGQQVEDWLQETAEALARRLTVAAMAAVVVWHLARDERPEARELRKVLVRLSGRQMKRGPKARGFTEPALLAGLGVLVPMLYLLDHYDLPTLQHLAAAVLPPVLPSAPVRRETG